MRLVEGGEQERAQYIVSHGFFKKGEIADICLRHLKADGELDTRQLAERVMCERKLEVSDTPLRNSVVFKVVQSLRHACYAASRPTGIGQRGWTDAARIR